MIKENIILEAIVLDDASKPIESITTSVKKLENGLDKITTVSYKVNKNGEVMKKTTAKLIPTINKFKMEWLSVMFTGMALKRAVSGVIKSQMDMWGISEALSSMWSITMIPIMDELSDKLYNIIMRIMDLPENTQMVIGLTVVGASVIGSIMETLGMVSLFFSSLPDALINVFGKETGLKMMNSIRNFFTSINWKGILSGLGIAISVYMVIQDLKQGQITAAIGSATIGVGIYTGNPYIIGIGVVLKIMGEPEFLAKMIAFGVKIIDFFVGIGEKIGQIISIFIMNAINEIFGGSQAKLSLGSLFPGFANLSGKVAEELRGYNFSSSIVKQAVGTTPGSNQVMTSSLNISDGVITPKGLVSTSPEDYIFATKDPASLFGGHGGVYAPNITVNATISNDYDVRKLADEINKYLVDKYNTSTKMRS